MRWLFFVLGGLGLPVVWQLWSEWGWQGLGVMALGLVLVVLASFLLEKKVGRKARGDLPTLAGQLRIGCMRMEIRCES